MEPLRLLESATALLAIAALGGVVMAAIRFSGKDHPPTGLAMLHGFLAAAGVTLLVFGAAFVGMPALANGGTALLVLAAVGGIVLNLEYHWKNRPLPKGLMVGHALVAVVGFLLVVLALVNTVRG
jgi:hypothetical protein